MGPTIGSNEYTNWIPLSIRAANGAGMSMCILAWRESLAGPATSHNDTTKLLNSNARTNYFSDDARGLEIQQCFLALMK